MESNDFMSCQLKVDTQSAGWHQRITKIISAVKGVSYWIDVERGVATVSGNVDLESLLKMLSKAGKHAELLRLESAAASSAFDHAHKSYHNSYDPDYYHHRYGNHHPDMDPTALNHYPVIYQPPSPVDVYGYPLPPSPVRARPCSTCCIV